MGPRVYEQPRFSILICNYNYAEFVGQAIRSALDQRYPVDRFEVIVVDDGSTDASRSVYAQFAADPRFRVVLQENRGQSAAFEAGVKAATADYVCLLDSDDLFFPNKLERVAAHISALGELRDNLFLCHDLFLEDTSGSVPVRHVPTWFAMMGIDKLPDAYTPSDPVRPFPFSIPCGLVFSRTVIAACLEALPTWAFPRGADGILCPAALLKTGCVHYLREQLGIYRIHGGNELASFVAGRYVPRFNPRVRAPKIIRFLEQWIDVLDQPAPQRATALDYVRRLEHLRRRLSASRQLDAPRVAVVVLNATRADANPFITASLQSHDQVEFLVVDRPDLPELEQMARGYAESDAEYVVFLRAGDRLDREFIEHHLLWRLHGVLVGVSCSDVRLATGAGSLVHANVFRSSGAWKQPLQHIPPLATPLKDWVAAPMSACMFRRSAFLDCLFARRADMPQALQQAGFWLVFQMQYHTAGVLRILETLSTCRLPDGAAANYGYLAAPSGINGSLMMPPIAETVAWLGQLYRQERALFNQWQPPAWHQRFGAWLASQNGP